MRELHRQHADVRASPYSAALEQMLRASDVLLDIQNRRSFERELRRSLAYVKRYRATAALLYLDVDRLKPINDRYGFVPLDSDGRTRCQVTLWKRRALQTILRPDESAWNFEARGSARTREMKILSYLRRENTPIPYLMSAISRGLWLPEAIALCREHHVAIEPFFRPLSSPHSWQRRLRRAVGRARLKRALRAQQGTPIELP